MTTPAEVLANTCNALSIVLAGRNSIHTWWSGMLGCALYAWIFYQLRLYADTTLQVLFIASSVAGWWSWRPGARKERPITRTPRRSFVVLSLAALAGAVGYGLLLRHYTDAYAPLVDSAVLTFSLLGQLLLVQRRVESWWCWLLVNSLAVPLYAARGLYLTALLYSFFWVNAIVSLRRWRRAEERELTAVPGVA